MKWNHVRKALLPEVAILLLGFLTGCGQTRVLLGWVASNQPGNFQASYITFSGSETRTVLPDTDGTLVVEYEAEVNKGILTISVEGADDGVFWVVSLDRDSTNAVRLSVEQDKRYAIIVHGDGAGGRFDLSWKVE